MEVNITSDKLEHTQKTADAFLISVSVSVLVFSYYNNDINFLLKKDPSGGSGLSLPSYNFQSGLSLENAAVLAVKKTCDLSPGDLYQFCTVNTESNQSVSPELNVIFLTALSIPSDMYETSQEKNTVWMPVDSKLSMVDANTQGIIKEAINELKRRARYDKIVFSLLPHEFSLGELQKVFEIIIGRKMDVRNFRKKIETMNILVESAHKSKGMAHRPPRLFSFDPVKFQQLVDLDSETRFF